MRLRTRSILVVATVGTLALAGLTGCGLRNGSGAAAAPDTGVDTTSVEAVALTALGIPAADLGEQAAPSATPDKRGRHPRRPWLRRGLGRNVEHGEVVVDTKDGTKTIDVQRGTITAISSTTVTVKSKDGFTLTWTLGSSKLRVIEHRSTVQPSELTAGKVIGIAGTRSGDTVTALLIVIPNTK
jgi:hypothetical protein